jgi:nitroreductase
MLAELIKARRTINDFIVGKTPDKAFIIEALEHAVWAPNHYQTEPWHFYLLGNKSKEKICRLNTEIVKQGKGEEAAEKKYKRWMDVPGWLVITSKTSKNGLRDKEDYAACCCVAQNLMLLLWDKGIGVKWTTGAVTRHDEFYEILNISPEEEMIVGLFWYGYPEEVPVMTKKPASEKLTELS